MKRALWIVVVAVPMLLGGCSTAYKPSEGYGSTRDQIDFSFFFYR